MDLKPSGPKGWAVIALVVFGLYILGNNPKLIRNVIKSFKGTDTPTDLDRADLKGRVQQALSFAREVDGRLQSYKARFDCPEAQLLDQAFLDPTSPLSVSPIRKDWYEARRTLSEYLTKHNLYIQKCRTALAEVNRPDKAEQWEDFPEECMAWSSALDEAISERITKLPVFDQVVLQIRMGRRIR